MEAELRELALKVKALETQKRTSADEAARIITAQRSNIESLRKENEYIAEQLCSKESRVCTGMWQASNLHSLPLMMPAI